jgi:metallophosphoesterase (TIGR00282 family)
VLKTPYAIRPLNLKKDTEHAKHGVGSLTINIKNRNICITNLLGNTIQMHGLQDNPFPLFKDFLKTVKADIHIVDLHTETTSEKNAFLLTFAKQVSAIIGTHTHVQTADEKIYKNTAYITDAGMTGPAYGIIGAKPDSLLDMFMGKSERFRLEPENGIYQFNGVVLSFDDKTNIVKNITRINFLETK